MSGVVVIVLFALSLLAGALFWLFPRSKGNNKTKGSGIPTFTDPKVFYKVRLVEREVLSHDTRRFRFGLPTARHVPGLPIGQHVCLRATVTVGGTTQEDVTRHYTLVSDDTLMGYVDLVIKVYFSGVHPQFPDGGKMSQHLEGLRIGDTIDMSGPRGRFNYHGQGNYSVTYPRRAGTFRKLGMVAGGTGITPMLQVVHAILRQRRSDDTAVTEMALLFANRNEDDILCRREIEQMQQDDPRFRVHYVLSGMAPSGWQGSVGHVNDDMLARALPSPATDTMILLCGPPGMVNTACKPNLKKIGHEDANIFSF